MTVPNLISQKVLLEDVAGDSMQRDAYLQEALSFSNDAMLKIQGIQVSGQPVLQRAFEVAEIMKEELEPRAISGEIQLSSQFTLDTLAALANDDWMNPQFKSSALGNAMRRRYSNQKSNLSHQIGQNVPSPHFFRDELGVYEGNLIEAITKWQGIEASAEDWLASIRIPTSVDSDLTFFLGVIWADGLNVDEEIDYKNLIKLSGRDKDHLFYNETLTPLVNSIFNKKVNILIPEKNYPILLLTSRAITTFVKGNFGFPSHKEKYGLPDFRVVMDEPIDEYGLTVLKQSFLTGIFAGMAKPYNNKNRDHFSVYLHDQDEQFMKEIYNLTEHLGLFGSLGVYPDSRNDRTVYKISFNGINAVSLYREGYMLNPCHYNKTSIRELIK